MIVPECCAGLGRTLIFQNLHCQLAPPPPIDIVEVLDWVELRSFITSAANWSTPLMDCTGTLGWEEHGTFRTHKGSQGTFQKYGIRGLH